MAAFKDDDDKHLTHQDSDDNYYGVDSDNELLQGKGSDADADPHLDDDDEIALEEDDTNDLPRLHDNFIVLKESDIRRYIEEHIDEVSSVLSVSRFEASILLLHYNWSVNKVHDAWFADENQARQKSGLFVKPLIQLPDHDDDQGDILCGICFESYPRDGIKSISCGHPYCNDCWSGYIRTAIANGPGCLLLKCPDPSCRATVDEDMVGLFVSEEEKNKYSWYFFMSYVEENKLIKWCPGSDCDNAIRFVAGSENFDVSCLCSHSFCWNCTQEAHRPVDCETVTNWMLKNNSESENVNYILAFTKPCPKCKKPIEKNQGCNHMTCRAPCLYQFCWICLHKWGDHCHSCNSYKADHDDVREKAKKYMVRYTHYFERWATNKKSMKKAAADLQMVQNEQLGILSRIQELPETQLSFLTEAWRQIIECRRVLTWTYAYGYYLSDEDPAKRNLFEYLQGQAESGLERLHDCAEKELAPFLKNQINEFNEFRKRLCSLTKVTKNYFENLVTALQNGLSDVNSIGSSSTAPKKPRLDLTMNTASAAAAAATRRAQSLYSDINDSSALTEEDWNCGYCTYVNNYSASSCTMCGRGFWTCDYCTFANSRTSTKCVMCSEPRVPN